MSAAILEVFDVVPPTAADPTRSNCRHWRMDTAPLSGMRECTKAHPNTSHRTGGAITCAKHETKEPNP